MAMALTTGTRLAPQHYEQQLLAQYERGELTLDEVEQLLETSVYHLAYRSQAAPLLTAPLLRGLLKQAHTYNAHHQLTGVLLHSHGQFVQVIEGPEAEVLDLYARIQRDTRHTDVRVLSEGPGPQRHFADWHMAFGQVAPASFDATLESIAKKTAENILMEDPYLRGLLRVVGAAT